MSQVVVLANCIGDVLRDNANEGKSNGDRFTLRNGGLERGGRSMSAKEYNCIKVAKRSSEIATCIWDLQHILLGQVGPV